MSASVAMTTCRLTVLSGELRVDLSVPVQMPIAELLASLVASLGPEAADEGARQGGWVLQRAGEPPLDPSSNLAASRIRDGDVLYLRTRSAELPELAFDDVLDAVATGVRSRTARWQESYPSTAAVVAAAAALGYALLAAVVSGPDWAPPAITAASAAVLLLLSAAALARAYQARGAALVAATFAIAFSAVAGATAVAGGHRLADFGAAQLLLGTCAAVLAATIALLSLGVGIAGFVAVITVGLLGAVGTAVASTTTLSAAGTGALIAAAGLAISPLLPILSFRLSRLPLPNIPTDVTDLRRDTGTVDVPVVLRQATRADQCLTGLVGGVAIAVAGGAAVLAVDGVSERLLALVLAAICLLRARLFTGRGQRALLLAAGGSAALAVLVAGSADVASSTRLLALVAPALVAGVVLLTMAVALPGRRYAPPWSRAADVLETLLVLSVVPLALAVMGVYGAVRGAAG